jgi:hypothetical protein
MTESCYIPIKRIQKEICQIIWDDTSGALNSLEQPNRIALPAPSPTGPWMELPKKYWRYHWIGYGWIWIGFSIGYKWEKKEYTTWIYIYYNNNSNNIYMYIMYIYILCLYIYYVYAYIWKSLQIHCRKSFGKDLQLVDFDKTWKSLSMYWKLRI